MSVEQIRKSGLKVITIDHLLMEKAAEKYPGISIDTALKSHGLDRLDPKDPALPEALRMIFLWRDREKKISSKGYGGLAINAAYLPVLMFCFAIYGEGLVWWFLFMMTIPVGFFGFFALWARRKNWIAKKLEILRDEPFVSLIQETLLENLPQRSILLEEAESLKLRLKNSEKVEQQINILLMQIRHARERLGEEGQDGTLRELEQEKFQQQELRAKGNSLLTELKKRLMKIDETREAIIARAELEMLRGKARKISAEEAAAFTTRAMTELELGGVELNYKLASLHYDLELAELKWQTENEVSG